MKEISRVIYAAEGKVFARKSDGLVLSGTIYLGKESSSDNYIEVDAPEPDDAQEE